MRSERRKQMVCMVLIFFLAALPATAWAQPNSDAAGVQAAPSGERTVRAEVRAGAREMTVVAENVRPSDRLVLYHLAQGFKMPVGQREATHVNGKLVQWTVSRDDGALFAPGDVYRVSVFAYDAAVDGYFEVAGADVTVGAPLPPSPLPPSNASSVPERAIRLRTDEAQKKIYVEMTKNAAVGDFVELLAGNGADSWSKAGIRPESRTLQQSDVQQGQATVVFTDQNIGNIYRTKITPAGSPYTVVIDTTLTSEPMIHSDKGYLSGFPDGGMHPDALLTRGELAAVINRLLILKPAMGRYNHWAAVDIASVQQAGYMKGYPDGSFGENQPVTRAELAVTLLRVKQVAVPAGRHLGRDVSGHWAESALAVAEEMKIITGYPDGTICPDKKVSRAEAAAMINRAFGISPAVKNGANPWRDIAVSHWAYGDLLAAKRK